MATLIESDAGNYKSTVNEITKYISKFSAPSILEFIAGYDLKINIEDNWGTRSINFDSLNRLSALVFLPKKNGTKKISNSEFIKLNQMVNSLDENDLSKESDDRKFLSYSLKIGYNQFIFNKSMQLYKLANYWFLFKRTNLFKNKKNYSLNDYFIKAINFSFEEFVAITLFIKAISHESQTIILSNIKSIFSTEGHFEKFSQILNIYSKSITELKNQYLQNKKFSLNEESPINFNILRDFPIIKFDNNRFLCPISTYLVQKNSINFYYYILDYYANEESKTNQRNINSFDNEFSQSFGIALEDLLESFFSKLRYKYKTLGEFKFNSIHSADYHLYETNYLYLIQIKNKRITLKSQIGNLKTYFNDIELAIIKPIKQNLNLLNNSQYIPELKKRMKFNQLDEIINVVIYPEEIYGTQFEIVKNFIELEINSYKQKINLDRNIKTKEIFLTLDGFQILVELSVFNNNKIIKLINLYHRYQKNPESNMNLPKTNPEFLHSFEEFLLNEAKGKKIQSPFIEENKSEFFENSNNYFKQFFPNRY